jgi:hypothetical protein
MAIDSVFFLPGAPRSPFANRRHSARRHALADDKVLILAAGAGKTRRAVARHERMCGWLRIVSPDSQFPRSS